MKKAILIILAAFFASVQMSEACTTAVISGRATPDGRSIIWKLRDTDDLENSMRYFTDGKYPYLGLVNSKDTKGENVWAGSNSEEEGTWGAANLKDDVPLEEKQRRYDALMSLQRGISEDFNRSRVGKTYKVLVDSVMDGRLIARSEFESPEVDGEIIVSCPPGTNLQALIGNFVNVKITEALDYDLLADLEL